MWTLTDLLTRIVDAVQSVLYFAQYLVLLVDHLLQSLILCAQSVVFLISCFFREFEPCHLYITFNHSLTGSFDVLGFFIGFVFQDFENGSWVPKVKFFLHTPGIPPIINQVFNDSGGMQYQMIVK